jgi:hypothetical protein
MKLTKQIQKAQFVSTLRESVLMSQAHLPNVSCGCDASEICTCHDIDITAFTFGKNENVINRRGKVDVEINYTFVKMTNTMRDALVNEITESFEFIKGFFNLSSCKVAPVLIDDNIVSVSARFVY